MKNSPILQRRSRPNQLQEEIKNTYYVRSRSPKYSLGDKKCPSDLFSLPPPIVKLIQPTEDVLSPQFLTRYKTIISRLFEWTFLYLLIYCGFGFGWFLFFAYIYYVSYMEEIETSQKPLAMESERILLTGSCPLTSLPATKNVSFTD